MRVPGSEITPRHVYLNRRTFLGGAAALGATALSALTFRKVIIPPPAAHRTAGPDVPRPRDELGDVATRFGDITSYNNYYEFSTDKYVVAGVAAAWRRPEPWTLTVDGEVHSPRTYGLDDLLRLSPPEERVYRMRCVEGWSMVIPWLGLPLGALLAHFGPTGNARYVEFTTVQDPTAMPNLGLDILDWPYVEGLRLDEAMHPLTLLATGLYGESLLNQNGAPLRLVVPWKYGFKGAKSIVRIRFTAEAPQTTWMKSSPGEYGFYSNVNPAVAHPRWSQARERRIGETAKRDTLPFNGYGEQVAALYAGMDLRKDF